MLVKELIDELKKVDPNKLVVLSTEDCGCVYGLPKLVFVLNGHGIVQGNLVILTSGTL